MNLFNEKMNAFGASFSFINIIDAAAATMTSAERATAYKRTGHGVSIYTKEEELNDYLVAYGEMHKAKLDNLFSKLDYKNLANFIKNGVTIIDWGCGQGLATLAFLEKFGFIKSEIKAIRLVEVSDVARIRAYNLVSRKINGEIVKDVKWDISKPLTVEELNLPREVPVLHLFSNILDVANLNITNVFELLIEIRKSSPSFVCSVSPKNYGASRISTLWQLLGMPKRLAIADEVISLKNLRYLRDFNTCTAVGLAYELEKEEHTTVDNRYINHAFSLASAVDVMFEGFPESWGTYYYALPAIYDLKAQSIDDINPCYAILNNIIARGNPSRANLYIENYLADVLGLTKSNNGQGGTFKFEFINQEEMKPLLNTVRSKIDPFKARPTFSGNDEKIERLIIEPILITRIQHAIVRMLATNILSTKTSVIKVLAIEHDFSCVKVALDNLTEMMSQLAALVQDSASYFSPIKFEVVDYNSSKNLSSNNKYDIVLEVSFYRRNEEERLTFKDLNIKDSITLIIDTARPTAVKSDFLILTADNIIYRPVAERLIDGTYGRLKEADYLQYFLQNIFRKEDFRPGQLPILNRALQDKSVIGLLPTGGGKSLTYQMAGMMQPGLVMVIDPLRSLMKDQYEGLRKNGVTSAAYLNSAQNEKEKTEALESVVRGATKFLFVSPERLSMPGFRNMLLELFSSNIYFSYGIIDEVHCVSEWGHDFRFTYLNLGHNIHTYVKRKQNNSSSSSHVVPLFGLTATASFDVLADVERELSGAGLYELDADAIIRYENTNRLELQYKVKKIEFDKNEQENHDYYQREIRNIKQKEKEYQQLYKKNIADSREKKRLSELIKIAHKDFEKNKAALRNLCLRAKENALINEISCQNKNFEELLTSKSLEVMKKRFIERESIEERSEIGQSILAANLDTALGIEKWRNMGEISSGGLVFCPYKGFKNNGKPPTALTVESIYNKLSTEFSKDVIRYFTGAVEDEASRDAHDKKIMQNQEDYINNKAAIMVATSAFGMGIDKPNIRFVFEMNHPKSIEAFVQEAGRAGRDRKAALATIFFLETQKGDINIDFDVVNFFHKNNFTGLDAEKLRIKKLFNEIEMGLEEVDGTKLETIKGFYSALMSYDIGSSINVTIPNQIDGEGKNDQGTYDKIIYRLCCMGLVEDVECLFPPGQKARHLRLKLIRLGEGGYYARLKEYLMRYFNEARANIEIEKAKKIDAENEILKCIFYIENFIYENIQSKKLRAMYDMNFFCREGLKAYKDGNNWLSVNEDLKDFIYYYFNSKYARTAYKTNKGEPYSLIDDCDSGKIFNFDIIEKYMNVVNENVLDGASPKDNIKHLLGATRLIARGSVEVNPALSILHAFCLCYLGINNTDIMLEVVKKMGEEGFLVILNRNLATINEMWTKFAWIKNEFIKRTDVPKLKLEKLFSMIRTSMHIAKIKSLEDLGV